jgi:general secretion pathway protein G
MSKGFTLVELLVVIAIIGVLATLVLLQLGTARARSRDTKRITDINQIRTAVEQYFEDNNGHYPANIDNATLAPKYITRVPNDPLVTTQAYHYAYYPDTNPTSFQIWANLEQNAAALSGAAHIQAKTLGFSGDAIDASVTDCSTQTAFDQNKCIYDQGVVSQ